MLSTQRLGEAPPHCFQNTLIASVLSEKARDDGESPLVQSAQPTGQEHHESSRKRTISVISADSSTESQLTTEGLESSLHVTRNLPATRSSKHTRPRITRVPSHVTLLEPAKTLLSRAEDVGVLSPLHVFVREQVEVFTATQVELSQPSPGRKNPIQANQVGLRCIHCRHLSWNDRIKRAVCYPTSVGRVYNSVSDMKFDHFSHCPYMPEEVKQEFEYLKLLTKKSSETKRVSNNGFSSTAQYYHDAARKLGMVDGRGGVFLCHSLVTNPTQEMKTSRTVSIDSLAVPKGQHLHSKPVEYSHGSKCPDNKLVKPPSFAPGSPRDECGHAGVMLLSSSGDKDCLNSIHCFVRKHIEVFSATEKDASAPAPGRRVRINVGQVGIRCVHCGTSTVRTKRSVCYPPSVGGIYHAVSNMKFDHFGICKGLPQTDRDEFNKLRESTKKKSTSDGKKTPKSVASSTAHYYFESAKALGLVDTDAGIRFAPDMTTCRNPDDSQMKADGISALMMAATNPTCNISI